MDHLQSCCNGARAKDISTDFASLQRHHCRPYDPGSSPTSDSPNGVPELIGIRKLFWSSKPVSVPGFTRF